ncbi:hypothetical protein [Nocardia sp. NPDC050406]|uniref:hypothetical protein n=1 Tax=Nocardia sp. NPDC050406 TaxID=3364318 RepID=UPI00378C08FC
MSVNPWAWNARNPYYETAFQVLDLDPTVDRATARARIAARRKRISYDASRFPLFGTPLGVAQINAAEEQLADPASRVAAELLTHRPEPEGDTLPELTELLELSQSLTAAAESADSTPSQSNSAADWLDLAALPALLPNPTDPPQEATA